LYAAPITQEAGTSPAFAVTQMGGLMTAGILYHSMLKHLTTYSQA
jgi:hypothetical protein